MQTNYNALLYRNELVGKWGLSLYFHLCLEGCMEADAIEKLLESVAAGETTPAEALLSLKKEPLHRLGLC